MRDKSADLDAFVRVIGARLPGPSRARAEILAELRDGLLESFEHHLAAGLAEHQARVQSLREFGAPETLARSFLPELAAERARRTVVAVLLAAPIVSALWLAAARSRPIVRTSGLFDGAAAHATAAVLIAAFLLAGSCTVVLTGRATRRRSIGARAPLLGAVATTAIVVVTDVALLVLLSWRLAGFPGTAHELALAAAIVASTIRLIVATRSARLCLQDARRP